jgi:heme/copper-type cytochrome/quinol oxidase subunit 2
MSLWLLVLSLVLSAGIAIGLAVLTAFVIFVAINNRRDAEDRSVQEGVATTQLLSACISYRAFR